ncbi:MarR family transcriptional regulator [Sphingomonas sp. MMS12-HWE2-04]|uniref:MarR family transcriptional regulator n=1 Tax=Sphingomonas sp. MMS12-HWE2-04 TaxID=3234199 RepID=UPI00384E2EC8
MEDRKGTPAPNHGTLIALAKHYLAQRRQRDRYFPGTLFADPAWDVLLDLYVAGLENRRVSVSNVCLAAAVPTTTALRWIGLLEEEGLVQRFDDPGDRRRAYLQLAPHASNSVRDWLLNTFGSAGATQ